MAGIARALMVALTLVVSVAACSGGTSHAPVSRQSEADLRPVLAQYDREIAAVESTLSTPYFSDSSAQINRAIADLRSELQSSASQIDVLVGQKAALYQTREDNAVAQLLAASQSSGPSQSEIAGRLAQTYREQYAQLRSNANRDMAAYQDSLNAQQRQKYAAFVSAVSGRTQRAFAARAQELREQEATYALDLARGDAPQLLPLQTKLRTLTLDSQRKAQLEARVSSIVAAEHAALARRRAVDGATLNAYRTQLEAQAKTDMAQMAVQLQTRAMANLSARRDVVEAQRAMAGRPLPLSSQTAPTQACHPEPVGGCNQSLQTQIATLRATDRGRFSRDAAAAIGAYTGARNDLTSRFSSIRDADATARQNALATIAELRRERAALAAQIGQR